MTKKSILEKIIKKKELKFVTLLTSSTPNFFNHSILGKVFYLRNFLYLLFKFKKSKIFLFYRNSFFLLFRRKQHKLLFNDFDYILVFDDLIKKYSLEAFPKSKLIYTHHKDYETYLSYKNKKKIIKKQYAVLLDENIFNHPDNFQWNKYYNKNNFSYYQEQYYELLNKFLLNFEKISKLEVVVAGHPKNFDNANNRKFYGNRKFVINKTFDLIKDCKIVLAHSSMSVSFAILLKKPIVFLNSSLMFKLGMFTKVLSLVVETNAPMLYMEDQLLDYKYLLNNKKILYKSYTNKFLKSSMSNKNKSIWGSLFEALTL